ncbi:MAG: putative ABC transport system permease protein [Candidatus Methanomarinus sp.]|nr:MAG: putative ABC transport system permease protein [ANME-2 cluster archaeon]
MKIYKCLKIAINMVTHSKLRSWLTIIGIVIGVASVITLVSIGNGMEAGINDELSGLGGNIITITPGYSKASGMGMPGHGSSSGSGSVSESDAILGRNDVQALKSIPELEYIDTNIKDSADVYYFGKSAQLTVTGVDQSVWSYVTTLEILEGRLLDPADQNVVVIGYDLSRNYFDEPIGINKILTIEEKSFKVVGILDESSGMSSNGLSIYMPLQSAYQVLDDKTNNEYDSITVIAKDSADIDSVVAKIEKKLDIVRHVNTIDDKDYTVTSMKQILEQISSVTGMITLFLGFVAGISLLVGAVGIANTMFTAVLEKTKEIGIMKAIGARNKDIMLIFLFNSGLVGIIGGIIGVFFGIVTSYLLGGGLMSTPRGDPIETVVSLQIVVLALFISVVVGISAGMIPAYQGSKLKPVDALRYE